jgi:DNA polymerase III epsilon subunit family exonuclease
MRWREARLVAFDTETTGLDPYAGARVVEFAAVELIVDGTGRVRDTRATVQLINPEVPIPREASKVSGITDDTVKDAPAFAEVADRIARSMDGAILIAHNITFDIGMLRAEFGRCARPWPRTLAEVDTLVLSQARMPELRGHKLEMVAQALGVTLTTAHRASADAEACGRCLLELASRHGAPDDLDGFIDWADAVGAPPATGHLGIGPQGLPVFLTGPHAGARVDQHADHLQWMTMALSRENGRWSPRFPPGVVGWARRWLRVRAAGRFRGGAKGTSPGEWQIDPPSWGSPS